MATEKVLADISAAKWTMSVVRAEPMLTEIVVGFEHEQVQGEFPDVEVSRNLRWEDSGSVASLFELSLDATDSLLVTYSDIVFSAGLVDDLSNAEADVVVAWDSVFLSKNKESQRDFELVSVSESCVRVLGRAARNHPEVGYFPGVVFFSPRGVNLLREVPYSDRRALSKFHVSELIEYLRKKGLEVQAIECSSNWARIEEPNELVRFILGSKADSLIKLRPLLAKSSIPESFVFEVGEWKESRCSVLLALRELWADSELVVRSSARAEDTFEESMAGAFQSVIGVSGAEAIERAIDQVISAYPDSRHNNQVLVQPRVGYLIANGVVLTRSLDGGAPWLTVNFELSDRSDGVTSGRSSKSMSLHLFRTRERDWLASFQTHRLNETLPVWMTSLLEAVREIEKITHYSHLDIEFGIDQDGVIHIFQVRPMTSRGDLDEPCDQDFEQALEGARRELDSLCSRRAAETPRNLPVFSNMTDWNPAEILGAAPRQLAVSLYEELITNQVWADSRSFFGYTRLSGCPLLKEIAGRPYVNVAASVQSLLPEKLDSDYRDALTVFYLQWLRDHPEQHDKMEFEVVPTCLTPKFPIWADRLKGVGGGDARLIEKYRDALKEITRGAIESIEHDSKLLKLLDEQINPGSGDLIPNRPESIERVLDGCRRYGTFPFANMARRAFVAMTLLNDAATAGIITSSAVDDFLSTIRTVSHSLRDDASRVRSGSMQWDRFVSIYGHLRPGTYDITSPRYDSEPERYLRPLIEAANELPDVKLGGSKWRKEREAFFGWVQGELGDFPDNQIEHFLRASIEGRESAKFAFTRLLSWVLEELKDSARELNISLDQISHLPLRKVIGVTNGSQIDEASREELLRTSERNRKAHQVTSRLKLPGLITSSDDLYAFLSGHEVANFVGKTRVIESAVFVEAGLIDAETIHGRIALIEAADPGFDWVFGHGIAGLITKYGGGNSHMAIRAAEFGLPAAIGVGESLFDKLVTKSLIELDPTNQIVRSL